GYTAALLTQHRPNVFTQKVANIEPGKSIDINISYFSPLPQRDGKSEFIFPTAVGPRFNPPGSNERIGTVAHGKTAASGQPAEVEYLKPSDTCMHHVSIDVELDAGLEIEDINCNTHDVSINRKSESTASVSLKEGQALPDRDFILTYRLAGKRTKTAMMVNKSADGNYFALMLQPPAQTADLPRMPREMVFVLDCSGSMSGSPLDKAKDAVRKCLANLDANDTFQIIRFSSNASSLGPAPIKATDANVSKGLRYLKGLNSCGGTMMIEGIKAALDFPHDDSRLRIVSFMTDGYIGNETEILAAIESKLGSSRIFSFGVGSSVNRYFLERMARVGRGAVAFVGLDDDTVKAVDEFYMRASRPALVDIEIDWGALGVTEVYPRKMPDLFVGRPVVICGKFTGAGPTSVQVSGRVGRARMLYEIDVDPTGEGAAHKGIRQVWARWKIAELASQEVTSPSSELRKQITETSIRYKVLSRYTALLAVDTLAKTTGDHGHTVVVPVPVPHGVRYDTTVESGE
ncbi:MAG TPA: VWA domain-containing protein, partial [Phycisphaerae bacterium]|nr:VWA domain-containing protein [Phycisphaerae bacterium]